MTVHPTAIVDASARLGKGVQIGPYAYVGADVELGDAVIVGHGATIEGPTSVGAGTEIFPQAAVGLAPQDLKYAGEKSRLEIGKNCKIREFSSLHRGTAGGGMVTRIGDNVLIMNGGHVGHDCQVGNNCIIAAQCALGGHVVMEDHAILGGLSGLHQFVRVGAHAMIGAGMVVSQDVPTYAVVQSGNERLAGVNLTGLKRRGFDKEDLRTISGAMKALFMDAEGGLLKDRVARVRADFGHNAKALELIDFVAAAGTNDRNSGFVKP